MHQLIEKNNNKNNETIVLHCNAWYFLSADISNFFYIMYVCKIQLTTRNLIMQLIDLISAHQFLGLNRKNIHFCMRAFIHDSTTFACIHFKNVPKYVAVQHRECNTVEFGLSDISLQLAYFYLQIPRFSFIVASFQPTTRYNRHNFRGFLRCQLTRVPLYLCF